MCTEKVFPTLHRFHPWLRSHGKELHSLPIPDSADKESCNQFRDSVLELECVLFGSSETDFLRYFLPLKFLSYFLNLVS